MSATRCKRSNASMLSPHKVGLARSALRGTISVKTTRKPTTARSDVIVARLLKADGPPTSKLDIGSHHEQDAPNKTL